MDGSFPVIHLDLRMLSIEGLFYGFNDSILLIIAQA